MSEIDDDAIKALEDARDVLDWLGENYAQIVPIPSVDLVDILNASVFLEALLLAIGNEADKARGAATLTNQNLLP